VRSAQLALAYLGGALLLLSTVLFTTNASDTAVTFAVIFAIAGLVVVAALGAIIVYEARRTGT
jgi:uncharacterized membrane protein (DUF485 family)